MSPENKILNAAKEVGIRRELEAFDKARAKAYPLVTRSAVIRDLIEKFVKETKA